MAVSVSAMSPIAQPYLTHTPPSIHNSRPAKQSTVHWDEHDLEHNLDLNNKESTYTIPDFHLGNTQPQEPASSRRAATSPSPSQDALVDLGDRKFRGQHRRPQIASETFVAPKQLEPCGVDTDIDPFGCHSLVEAARELQDRDSVFEKHRQGQFEWVLSLSAIDVDQSLKSTSRSSAHHGLGKGDRRDFGCNLLDWTKPTGSDPRPAGQPEDKYLLLATPIDLQAEQSSTTNVEFSTHQFHVIQEHTRNINMAASQPTNAPVDAANSAYRPSPLSATSTQWSTAVEAAEDSDNTLTIDPVREMKAPLSTVEDSIEQLDRFEDDMDALTNAASQMSLDKFQDKFAHVVPKEVQTPLPSKGARQSLAATSAAQRKAMPFRPQKCDSFRDSPEVATTSLAKSDPGVSQKPPTATLRKVARPASLAPPKPIQKATKQPTISTFELPGERVARELKEKKDARLSMQVDPQKTAQVNSPQRIRSIRSSKPPTVANFELPGEQFSRQKKERFEQKLKEEEEEARRRRQFKARPSPATIAPTVRSTFTSRQRQTPAQAEPGKPCSPAAEPSPRSGGSKRQSATMTPSAARTASASTASTVSASARGRTSSIGSTQASTRATSSSVCSNAPGNKRSSVSAEVTQKQKVRGRQIYNRDNTTGRSKEQEKRDREEAIKLARQKYAQMSRNLAATSRARRSQAQSSSAQAGAITASPKEDAPQVPKHRDLYVGRNF